MDKQIYELMAQAEILQEHALALQNKASEAILEIPEAIDQAKRKIRSVTLWSVVVCLFVGIAVFFILMVVMRWEIKGFEEEKNSLQWEIGSLQSKVEKLQKEVQNEEKRLADVQTWGIELVRDKGQRWIKLGNGDKAGETRTGKDGTVWINIARGK